VVETGYGTSDLATMEEVAAALGGDAVAVECGDPDWIDEAAAAYDADDVGSMKDLLGEG
jgi:hypothetical protein